MVWHHRTNYSNISVYKFVVSGKNKKNNIQYIHIIVKVKVSLLDCFNKGITASLGFLDLESLHLTRAEGGDELGETGAEQHENRSRHFFLILGLQELDDP